MRVGQPSAGSPTERLATRTQSLEIPHSVSADSLSPDRWEYSHERLGLLKMTRLFFTIWVDISVQLLQTPRDLYFGQIQFPVPQETDNAGFDWVKFVKPSVTAMVTPGSGLLSSDHNGCVNHSIFGVSGMIPPVGGLYKSLTKWSVMSINRHKSISGVV